MNDKKLLAKQNIDAGFYAEAITILSDILDVDPNDAQALFMFGAILIKQNKYGLAYNICARTAKLEPNNSAVWANYGICQPDNAKGWAASEWCLNKAIELNPQNAHAMAQLASLMIQTCKPKEAKIFANHALKIDPDNKVALGSKAFAYLMEMKWQKGFEYYKHMLQTSFRLDVAYGDLPMWDGSKGETVIVYGEQGIGDELLFASVLNDMAKDCTIIYDTMPRLVNLMQRSFTNIHVTGNRWSDTLEYPHGVTPTARLPLAGVPVYYRKKQNDFDGKPYLKVNNDMQRCIKGLLSQLPNKLKIGIAWTGGAKSSRQHLRTKTLEDLTPLLRIPGIDWVSLQYKDHAQEIADYKERRGITIHDYPWITQIKEYDFTAALINELDLIISVPTSAVQVAGALGVPAWVMVPEKTGWLFLNESYPWASSVSLFHDTTPSKMATELKTWLGHNTTLKQVH